MNACTHTCNQGRKCVCTKQCQSAAPEGGNFWPDESAPVELDVFEAITIYCVLAILSVISIGLVAAATGFIYQHFFN